MPETVGCSEGIASVAGEQRRRKVTSEPCQSDGGRGQDLQLSDHFIALEVTSPTLLEYLKITIPSVIALRYPLPLPLLSPPCEPSVPSCPSPSCRVALEALSLRLLFFRSASLEFCPALSFFLFAFAGLGSGVLSRLSLFLSVVAFFFFFLVPFALLLPFHFFSLSP